MDTNTLIIGGTILLAVLLLGIAGKYFKEKKSFDSQKIEAITQIAALISDSFIKDKTAKEIAQVAINAAKLVEETMSDAPEEDQKKTATAMVKSAMEALQLPQPISEEKIDQVIDLAFKLLRILSEESPAV